MPESSEIASEREELQTKMNCRLGVMACMHARRVCHESASARERQLRRSLAAAEAEIAAVSVSDLTAECQADWVRISFEKDLGFVSNTGNQGGTAIRGGGGIHRGTHNYYQSANLAGAPWAAMRLAFQSTFRCAGIPHRDIGVLCVGRDCCMASGCTCRWQAE